MVTTRLKLCPFCGSAADLPVPWHGGGPDKVLIRCSNERCQHHPSIAGENVDEAVRIWNKRTRKPGAWR